MAGLVKLFKQKWNGPMEPTESFAGRTIVVTGSNTGLGFEAALKFVNLGASKVILAVRSVQKGEDARRLIERSTGRRHCVEVWPLDMTDYSSIQSFADRAHKLERLDIAVLNAGVFSANFNIDRYGWERTVQVNTLSTTLLALLLLPKLKASQTSSSTPVLEFVSSGTHKMTTWSDEARAAEKPMDYFNQQTHFSANKQYAASKVFLMCALPHIANLATPVDSKPTVNVTSVCPGACKSSLGRDYIRWWAKPLIWLFFALFFRSASQGARTLVSGTTLGEKGNAAFWQHDKLQE